jgi:hypothetical protein
VVSLKETHQSSFRKLVGFIVCFAAWHKWDFFTRWNFCPKLSAGEICRHGAVEGFSDAPSGQVSLTSLEGELMSQGHTPALPMRSESFCFTAPNKKDSKENGCLSED